MNKIVTYIAGSVAGIVGVTAPLSSVYKIDQTEQAVITQFGRPVGVVLNSQGGIDNMDLAAGYTAQGFSVKQGPGLHLKLPYIQTVNKLDNRWKRHNGYPDKISTSEKKYVEVDSSFRWRIADPVVYLQKMKNESSARAKLDGIVDSAVRSNISKHELSEIVRTDDDLYTRFSEDPQAQQVSKIKFGRQQIMSAMTTDAQPDIIEYGMDIHHNGILLRSVEYGDQVKQSVESSMIQEREKIAAKLKSEGQGLYREIIGTMQKELDTIESSANREAAEMIGQADSLALATINGVFEKDPVFFSFVQRLELLEKTYAGGNGKIEMVVSPDNELFTPFAGSGLDGIIAPNSQK